MHRPIRVSFALLFLASVVLFSITKVRAKSAGLPASVTATPPTPLRSQPKSQRVFSGFWRVDHGFESTLRIKNVLITQSLSVSPVIYMADGSAFALPSVELPPGGIHDVSVNEALQAAPSSVRAHLSEFGSAAVDFTAPSVMNAATHMQVLNTAQSLIFTSSSRPILPAAAMSSGEQTLESLWWKHDAGVSVFAAVSNMSGASKDVQLEVLGSAGSVRTHRFALAARATEIVTLDEIIAELPDRENQTGGIRAKFEGTPSDIFAATGLVNPNEGYSATSEFHLHHEMGSASTSHFSIGSVGLMVGVQDPMMGFPKNTQFTVYAALRNTSDRHLEVKPQLFLMDGAAPRKVALPTERLAPHQAKQLSLASALSNFNGMATLTFSYDGHPGDVLIATGSVDQTATYVFEVMPNSLDVSWAKSAPFWSTAGGFDSMLTVFNPKGAPEDIIAKLTYIAASGPGHYSVPLHLAAGETRVLDVKDLIDMQQPDSDGNLIPSDVTEGSAQFAGANGISQEIQIGVSTGIFNVQTATCGGPCLICQTTTDATLDPNPTATVLSDTQQVTFTLTLSDGSVVDETSSAHWSSSNTSVATVQTTGASNPGLVSGIAIGNATLTAFVNGPPEGPAPSPDCQSKCGLSTITRQGPAVVLSVVVHFGPGPKAGDDLLSFTAPPNFQAECSESLGRTDCSSASSTWHWNLEGKAVTNDSASNWTVAQSVQYRQKGFYRDSNNNLQSFTCSGSNSSDGPNAGYIQQSQNTTYWIDGPGSSIYYSPSPACGSAPTQPIDQMTLVFNFQVKYSHSNPTYSRIVYHYVKLVVSSGGHLDATNSVAAYGNISLNF